MSAKESVAIGQLLGLLESRYAIRVLWALPIYRIEAEYRHLHGLEELERKLEADGVDVLDPFRNPAVQGG